MVVVVWVLIAEEGGEKTRGGMGSELTADIEKLAQLMIGKAA